MRPDPKKRDAPVWQDRGVESQNNVCQLRAKPTAIPDLARVLSYLQLATALVECAATIMIQGDSVSVAGRDTLLQVALRLHEIRRSLDGS